MISVDWDAIDAVVFDIGGVIALPHHDPIRDQLRLHGFDAPLDDEPYRRAHYAGMRAMHRDHPNLADDSSRDVWKAFDRGYLYSLGFTDADADAANSFGAMFAEGVQRLWTWVQTDAVRSMHELAASGMPIAIVSNNDGTAEEQMRDFGVGQLGDGPGINLAAIVDSTAIGIAKPDPRIFQPALDALAVDPVRALYVGDTVHADVRGATAASMPVVQIDPYDFHADLTHERSRSVSDIVARLT